MMHGQRNIKQVNVYGKLSPITAQPELQISIPRTQCFQQPLELRLSTYGSRLKLKWVAELFWVGQDTIMCTTIIQHTCLSSLPYII